MKPPTGAPLIPRAPRRPVRLPCWLEVEGEERLGLVTHLSPQGIGLRLMAALEPVGAGRAVRFRLLFPKSDRAFEGAGTVVWEETGRHGQSLGVRVDGAEALFAQAGDVSTRVWVLDEDPDYLPLYRALGEDVSVSFISSAEQVLERLGTEEPSVLVLSEHFGATHALELLGRVRERFPKLGARWVVVSEFTVGGEYRHLVNAGGIFAFVRKPFDAAHLGQVVAQAVDDVALAAENGLLAQELERANQRLAKDNAFLRRRAVGFDGFEEILGRSPELRRVLDELERLRRTELSVFIQGETGTGKELVARALHRMGPRAGRPFVAQNCAGVPESLLQSLLFGHRKGAFTGADRDHEGLFQRAHGGTLFLDEVAELSLPVQVSLLRALQHGEVTPLGAEAPLRVDVRVLSASHTDLRAQVERGRFREDLFYRLVAHTLGLPPLRARQGDIPLLARHFLDLHCEALGRDITGFRAEAMRALELYPWPGNVRELRNEIERAVVLFEGPGRKISLALLSSHIAARSDLVPAPEPEADGLRVPPGLSFDEAVLWLDRELVGNALRLAQGNISRAARALGVDRTRLSKLRDRLGLPV